MKSCLFIVVSIFLFSKQGNSQDPVFSRLFSQDQLVRKAILIQQPPLQNKPESAANGTCEILNHNGKFMLVTANHVASKMRDDCQLVFSLEGNQPLIIGLAQITSRPTVWKHHPHADISIIEITPIGTLNLQILNDASFLLDNVLLSKEKIDLSTDVLMMGFPIVDAVGKAFSPLFFETKTASVFLTAPCKDSANELCDALFLQAPSYQGLSGGPATVGIRRTGFINQDRTWLIGIISATMFDNTGGKAAKIVPAYYLKDILGGF